MTPPGSMRTRTPLLIVFAAFAANAAVVVLQTVVFQLLPYDSAAFSAVSLALRGGFLVADVALLVSFVALFRTEPTLRGLVSPGALLAAFAVASGLTGLAARAGGTDAFAMRSFSLAIGAAEPMASLGAALLAILTLGALRSRRTTSVTVFVGVSIAITLGFRMARVVDSGPRSLSAAWTSWLFEVARPLVIALFALSVARAIAATAPPTHQRAGPYRESGEGAPLPATREVPDGATAESFRAAVRALSIYRGALFFRIAAVVLSTLIFLLAAMTMGRNEGIVVVMLSPVSSLATAIAMAIAMVRLLALARASRARGVAIAALVAISVIGLVDAATVAYGLDVLAASSSYHASRDFHALVLAEWPFVALCFGVSMLFMASLLRRVGEKVGHPAVVGRARWVQGLAVGAGAAQLGFILSFVAMQASWASPRSSAGNAAVFFMALAAGASTIAVLVMHGILLAVGRRALLAYADGG